MEDKQYEKLHTFRTMSMESGIRMSEECDLGCTYLVKLSEPVVRNSLLTQMCFISHLVNSLR